MSFRNNFMETRTNFDQTELLDQIKTKEKEIESLIK